MKILPQKSAIIPGVVMVIIALVAIKLLKKAPIAGPILDKAIS